MQLRCAHDVLAQCFVQRFQEPTRRAHPIGKSGALQFHTFSRVDLRLTIQRQVVCILRNENMGQQPRTCHAACNRPARRFRLHDHVALGATHLRANMPNHFEAGRNPFQHFGDVLAELVQFRTAGRTTLRGGHMRFHFTRQMVQAAVGELAF